MKAFPKQYSLIKFSRKNFAGKKKKVMDLTKRDFDMIVVGGLNGAQVIKYFQHKHFHGTIAGFSKRLIFYNEASYEYGMTSNFKAHKFTAMPFGANFDNQTYRMVKEHITGINPEKNQVTTEKGETWNYNTLVLNTGLDQSVDNLPFSKELVSDPYAHSRVFAHITGSSFHYQRNSRIMINHPGGDFIVYIPSPNRREATDHWYLMLDHYFAKGYLLNTFNRDMKIRVITPEPTLFKFPFANEIVNDEISQRSSIEIHYGTELVDVQVTKTDYGHKRIAKIKDLKTGNIIEMNFGTLLATPNNKKRKLFENNDVADENGLVNVNPYTLQHQKYQNIFAFGDCANLPTTKSLYASLNQLVVLRTNVWNYLHGKEFNAIYEGYTSFQVYHAVSKFFIFKHYYDYQPTTFNFYLPKFLGYIGYKLKTTLETEYMKKILGNKPNYGYPYITKDRYFRTLPENRFLKKNQIPLEKVLIHKNVKPELSFEKEHHGHVAVAH